MVKKTVLKLMILLALPLAALEAQEKVTDGRLFGTHAAVRGSGDTGVRVGGHLLLPLNGWLDLYPSVGIEVQQNFAQVHMSAMVRFRPFQSGPLSPFYGAVGAGTLRDRSETQVVDRLVVGGEWPIGRWTGFVEWEGLQWVGSGYGVPQSFGFLVGLRQRRR
jgi:hypothetical protein